NARLLTGSTVTSSTPVRKRDKQDTVLRRVQQHLLYRVTDEERLPQDNSLQIIGCPGRMREIETVYHSILHNLATNPALMQTDIAILVTDMAAYRPVIQSVFDRPPRRLSYNLADYSASVLSVYVHAFL